MKLSCTGRRALVTGTAQGLGRAIALMLHEAGAEAHGVDIDEHGIDGVTCHQDDITVPGMLSDLVGKIGPVDIGVHVAGGVRGQVGRPLEEITPADWEAIVAVNQTAAFYLAQAIAPAMKQQSWGRIVTISSRAGLDVSLTGIQAYASAKAGQIGLVRQLGHELGAFGITVNCVAPGFVRSNPTTERQWQALGEEGQKKLVDGIAMKRLGTPEDIAAAVLFLVSEQASWITGQVLSVDGGR
jgi:3-oxoacyl-[acyl-carrier protein] reductase